MVRQPTQGEREFFLESRAGSSDTSPALPECNQLLLQSCPRNLIHPKHTNHHFVTRAAFSVCAARWSFHRPRIFPRLEVSMSHVRCLRTLGAVALMTVFGSLSASAQEIKTVFVIAMENHNWTQPANQFTGGIQQIFQNPAAPFINSLVNGTATAVINGRQVNISRQVAYATNYRSVLATAGGANPHIHPSEPNYIWAEAGTNFGVFNDNDPFAPASGTGQLSNQDNQLHLTTLFDKCGVSWKSYQEDIDLVPDGTSFDNVVLPQSQWTSPIKSFSGNFVVGVNQFNGSTQFNYAVKHNPQAFFTDSNGGNDTTTANVERLQYAPLQQLFTDLNNNAVARYNWITPNQFNDQHTALTGGFK